MRHELKSGSGVSEWNKILMEKRSEIIQSGERGENIAEGVCEIVTYSCMFYSMTEYGFVTGQDESEYSGGGQRLKEVFKDKVFVYPSQIICVLEMLDLEVKVVTSLLGGAGSCKKSCNFGKIDTGEGKSDILAVVAWVLSFFGHAVDIGCLNCDVSDKDRKQFVEFYSHGHVDEESRIGTVIYGEFSTLFTRRIDTLSCYIRSRIDECIWYEDQLAEKDFRDLNESCRTIETKESVVETLNRSMVVEEHILTKADEKDPVLLFDEAEVFFSRQFYLGTMK